MVTIIKPTVLLKLSATQWKFNRWVDPRSEDSTTYWDNCFKASGRLMDTISKGRTILELEVIRKGQDDQ